MIAEFPKQFVGFQPRFPGILNRWRWLVESVPAERAAALRIAVALALLLDLALGCLPFFSDGFTSHGLAGSEAFPLRFREGHWYWSALRWLPDASGPYILMVIWIVAAMGLLIGYRPLYTGMICWFCAVSFWNINPWICNGGDQVRNMVLLIVAFGRTGEVWSISATRNRNVRLYVAGWPYKLLILYLICMYFFSGLYKLQSGQWRTGWIMYYVNHNRTWSLAPEMTQAFPIVLHRLSAWVTLAWELTFPIFLFVPRVRAVILWLGVLFHLGSFLTLEIGSFGTYTLASYAAFVTWERFREFSGNIRLRAVS